MMRVFIFVLAVACGLPLAGQSPLTLTDAVRAALATHPAVRAAGANADAAGAGVGQARAAWLPAVGLDASAMRFGDPMVVAPLHGFDPTQPPLFNQTLWQASLNGSWDLFNPDRAGQVGRARAEAAAADAGASATEQAVMSEVARAYLDVVTARDLVAAHDARVAALSRERDRARLFVQEGRAARVSQLRADAALASARAERLTAVGRRDAADRALERVAGMESGTLTDQALAPVRRSAGDAIPTRDDALAEALQDSPEILRRTQQVAAAEALQGQAHAAWLPRLRVLGRLVQYGSGDGAEATEWQAGVAVSYPLFTGGARSAAGAQASARVLAAAAGVADARRQLGDAVDRALAGLQSAAGRVEALDVAMAQATEVVRIERLALTEGAGVQTDYLTAEAELLHARAARSEARAAEIGARIELARLMGVLSPTWLAEHLESGS